MRQSSNFLLIVAVTVGLTAPIHASEFCSVVDAKTAILNGPGGITVGSAGKADVFQVLARAPYEGASWMLVSRQEASADPLSEAEAFVFADYLSCDSPIDTATRDVHLRCIVADPTGEPLNIRADPSGDVKGTVSNGTVLRVFDVLRFSEGAWAHAYRNPYDNAVGWLPDDPAICR